MTSLASLVFPPALPSPRYVGVWQQPTESFDHWKSAGVNLLVGCPTPPADHDPAAWIAAAVAKGLRYILHDQVRVQEGWYQNPWTPADANLVAIAFEDEANAAGNQEPAQIAARLASIRQRGWRGPVFLNLDGAAMDQTPADAWIVAATDSVCPPWIGFDHFITNRGLPDVYGRSFEQLLTVWTDRIAAIRRLSPGCTVFVFLETSFQKLNLQEWAAGTPLGARMAGPTVQQVQAEWAAIVGAGAVPILFPDVIGENWEAFDGTPADVLAAVASLAKAAATPPVDGPAMLAEIHALRADVAALQQQANGLSKLAQAQGKTLVSLQSQLNQMAYKLTPAKPTPKK